MTPSDREAAGQRIARARKRRGLSQAVLAGLVGRSESWLSQVERGKRGVDGQLWLARDTYAAETAWAPRHTGKELRLSRLGAFDAALAAIRADTETVAASKAGDHDRAARHETLAASYRALRDHYQHREHDLTQDLAARQEWEHATERSRRLAIAADAELRRRHPGWKIEPLRSAEPASASDTGCDPCQLGNLYNPGLSHGLTCGAGCPRATVGDPSLPGLMAR
jgi:transcriptional regulator with XRE-family HTH domain